MHIDHAAGERVNPTPEAEPCVRRQHEALPLAMDHGLSLHGGGSEGGIEGAVTSTSKRRSALT